MEELEKLQYLSLVSKVCTELENHLGFNDKDMAEFIIQLADENSTFDSFKLALIDNQAQFTDSFIGNLLRIIQHMRPNKNKNYETNIGKDKDDKELKRALYPCLALPDKEFEKENIEDIQDTEDTMKLFEQLSKENTKLENEKSKHNHDIDSRDRHKSKHKSSKESRRDRSRSPSSKHHHRDSSRHNHKSRRYYWQIIVNLILNLFLKKYFFIGQEVDLLQELIIKIRNDKNMKNYLKHQLLEQY